MWRILGRGRMGLGRCAPAGTTGQGCGLYGGERTHRCDGEREGPDLHRATCKARSRSRSAWLRTRRRSLRRLRFQGQQVAARWIHGPPAPATSSRSARLSPRECRKPKVVLQGSGALDLACQLAPGALGRGPQLLNAALSLARPTLKSGNGVAECCALATQDAQRTLKPDGVQQRDGQKHDQHALQGDTSRMLMT